MFTVKNSVEAYANRPGAVEQVHFFVGASRASLEQAKQMGLEVSLGIFSPKSTAYECRFLTSQRAAGLFPLGWEHHHSRMHCQQSGHQVCGGADHSSSVREELHCLGSIGICGGSRH